MIHNARLPPTPPPTSTPLILLFIYFTMSNVCVLRPTRLLTAETEVNGCSSRPSTNIFFLTVHYFNSFVPIAQQAELAALLGGLSLRMCLWP